VPQASTDTGGATQPTISTHVLDTGSGRPAVAVPVILSKLDDAGRPIRMTQILTDADGRVRDLLERPLTTGVYRLEFNPPRRGSGDGDRFFERIAVDFRVDDASRSYHVPLLLAPYSMMTYRGS
jgi:5-hydroxyisourate hydrolase